MLEPEGQERIATIEDAFHESLKLKGSDGQNRNLIWSGLHNYNSNIENLEAK